MVTDGGVLRRKLAAAARMPPEGEGAARAWRVAFPRAAMEGIGLDLAVPALRDERQSLTELLELIPDRALLALLEGPGQGLGLMVLSPDLLSAVIEAQTVGRVAATPPLPRRPTRTDAAMSARLIDQALALLDTALAQSADVVWAGGFRYASFLDEARALGLLLEELPYRLLSCELEVAGGARRGQLLLALPAEGRGPRPSAPPQGDVLAGPDWQTRLQAAVMGAEVTLTAVLGRVRLPLVQAMALEPGMVLPLADGGLDQVAVTGAAGTVAGTARLGQHRGLRALKLGPRAGAATRPPGDPPPTAEPLPEAAAPPPVARSA